jgi:hypothetical protein
MKFDLDSASELQAQPSHWSALLCGGLRVAGQRTRANWTGLNRAFGSTLALLTQTRPKTNGIRL